MVIAAVGMSLARVGRQRYYQHGAVTHVDSLPLWLKILMGALFTFVIIAVIAVVVLAVRVQRVGGIRIAYPAFVAKRVAKELQGRFLYGVGKVLQGSYATVKDSHAPRQHFVAMRDDFERVCQMRGVWVPLDLPPFSTGANRYLLNYVSVPRPYGSLAAYQLRYDDPTFDWHLVMVYDIAPDPAASNGGVVQADRERLLEVMRQSQLPYPVQVVEHEGHVLLLLADCMPTGLARHYEALRELN